MNRRQQRAHDYFTAFGTPAGKRVLDDLEIYRRRVSFVPGDSHETAFREGQRSLCELIHQLIQTAKNPSLMAALEEEEEHD